MDLPPLLDSGRLLLIEALKFVSLPALARSATNVLGLDWQSEQNPSVWLTFHLPQETPVCITGDALPG